MCVRIAVISFVNANELVMEYSKPAPPTAPRPPVYRPRCENSLFGRVAGTPESPLGRSYRSLTWVYAARMSKYGRMIEPRGFGTNRVPISAVWELAKLPANDAVRSI